MAQAARPHRGRASLQTVRTFREVGLDQCPSERKGEGNPGSQPARPFSRPRARAERRETAGLSAPPPWNSLHRQTSALEGGGFALPIPGREAVKPSCETVSKTGADLWGTEGSIHFPPAASPLRTTIPCRQIWCGASFDLNHNQMAQPGGSNVPPWNKGRKVGQKRALRPQEVWLIRDRLRRKVVSAIWRCSISRWTANCRPAISSACKSAMFGIRIACASGGVLCCSARVSRCSLRSRPRPKRQSQSGCPFLVLRCDRSISSPAGSIRDRIFQGGNILASFAIGSKVRDLIPMCTGHNRCGAPRCC